VKSKIHSKNPIPSTLLPKLKGAYIVGGSIRDLLLGHTPADYDLAVLGPPEPFAAKVASAVSGRIVTLGKPGEALYRIVSTQATIDITQAKGDAIETDLRQRDFTVNAIAYDLSADAIIDPCSGMKDISRRVIRMVSDGVFHSDPLRLLRAFRLAAVLNFTIDPKTERTIQKSASWIQRTARERIRDELIPLFATPAAFPQVSRMAENGLLFSIIPELFGLKGCLQNRHHELDVLSHTLQAFYHLEHLLDGLEEVFPENFERLNNALPAAKCALLKCAILLHDIGKPSVRTEDSDHRVHFYGHEKNGAHTAGEICRRLRFSNLDIAFLQTVIRYHLRPQFLFQAYRENRLTPRAVTRCFMDSGDNTPAILMHALADFQGKKASPQKPFEAFINELIHRYYSDFQPKQAFPPLITGSDLIHEFGLTPSAQFKDILSRVEVARLSNRITTRKEAVQMVIKFLRTAP